MLCWAAYLLIISLIALCAYGIDKKRARRHQWRIPEKVLLGLGFLGGAAGALLAMRCFRHKTKHWYFWAVNMLGLLWQMGVLVWLAVQQGL